MPRRARRHRPRGRRSAGIAVGLAEEAQGATALAEAVELLVEHVRVDHQQAVLPTDPVNQWLDAMAAGLAIEDGEVEPGVEGDDRDRLGKRLGKYRGDLLDGLAVGTPSACAPFRW